MILEVTMYQAVCDGCGEEDWAFSTASLSVRHAKSRLQWKEVGGKLYCPDCYEYDKETDSYKPKKKED